MRKGAAYRGKQNYAAGKKAGEGAEPEAKAEYGAVTTFVPFFPQQGQGAFRGLCSEPWQAEICSSSDLI